MISLALIMKEVITLSVLHVHAGPSKDSLHTNRVLMIALQSRRDRFPHFLIRTWKDQGSHRFNHRAGGSNTACLISEPQSLTTRLPPDLPLTQPSSL